MPNKYHYLQALARIREYVRGTITDAAKIMPDEIRDDFNMIAAKLGSDSGKDGTWCAR